jgi:predicted dehydrogenase
VRKTTIVGERKMVVFDDTEATEKLRIYNNHAEVPQIRSYGDSIQVRFGDILIPRVETTEPLKIECQHFIDCVKNRTTPLSDARDGLRVIRILEAAQCSMEQDGVPVRIQGANSDKQHSSVISDRRWHALRV